MKLREFEASLVYSTSSVTGSNATWRNPVLNNQVNKQTNKQINKCCHAVECGLSNQNKGMCQSSSRSRVIYESVKSCLSACTHTHAHVRVHIHTHTHTHTTSLVCMFLGSDVCLLVCMYTLCMHGCLRRSDEAI